MPIKQQTMQNKFITPPKYSVYTSILHTRKRKSIFGSPSPTQKKNQSLSQDYLTQLRKTEKQRTAEELIEEIAELLETLKLKEKVYSKAEQQNRYLVKQNQFLKLELDNLRVAVNHKQQMDSHLRDSRLRNMEKNNQIYKAKFRRVKQQLNQLKRFYNSQEIDKNFDAICEILEQ